MRSFALRTALAAAVAGSAAAAASAQAEAAPDCRAVPADESAITAMTNATRAAHGLARMSRDDDIGDAARAWSLRMGRTGDFVHSTLAWARGRTAGENIAQAGSAAEAYRALLASPPHRRNILTRSWRFVGVGAARCDGALYVTMNLMAAPGIRP